MCQQYYISIRADRMHIYQQFQPTHTARGATRDGQIIGSDVTQFQSTRPVRGATFSAYLGDMPLDISIHAPRAGRDLFKVSLEL